MTFIITLISLLIERFFDWNHLRQWRWFTRYQAWVGVRFATWSPPLILLISLILPILVVALINHLLTGVLFGSLKLIFGVIILVYSFGPTNFWAQFYTCVTAFHKEEPQVAMEKVNALFGITVPQDPQGFHNMFTGALFIEANRRIFAVLFWFLLLGPAGALLYRMTDLCRVKGISVAPVAAKFQRVLDWLPVRVLTFFFALGGHFTQVMHIWKHSLFSSTAMNDNLLSECGIAALDVIDNRHFPEDGTAEQEALSLLDRTFVIALVFLALIVLI
jgi:AmpE protein